MALWSTTLRIDTDLRLLVRSSAGNDLIKAKLPVRPPHPRALLTMLEGIALYSGEPIYVVVSAGVQEDDWIDAEQWCEELWPAESPLVRFDFLTPHRVRRAPLRLRGADDVRNVRRQLRLFRSR